ncbi:MAG: hypothetical protein RLZZ15_4080 [Verrucomicrobiota bacterium]|jgi:UDP-N-acetylglucosamine 2-epimerase
MLTVAVVLGTRPEAIKVAPLIHALQSRPDAIRTEIVLSGQHLELVTPLLEFFRLVPTHSLQLMQPGQTLASLTSRAVAALDATFAASRPDWVVVQGDTTTAMSAALAAFYQKIPVAHLEAGLRTDSLYSPFPEEINRRIIGQIASLHWAPTTHAAAALAAEKLPLPPARLVVTGNTGIDALLSSLARVRDLPTADADCAAAVAHRAAGPGRAVVLVTGHRRENFGEPFRQFCAAIADSAAAHPHALFIYPVHPNPNVRAPVEAALSHAPNVRLTSPKNYPEFIRLLDLADLILTDSGGVQEEAPSLGKRVLVTRHHTERGEGIATGHVQLVGPDYAPIVAAVAAGLAAHRDGRAALAPAYPYGDGRAAARCVASLLAETFAPFTA